MTLEVSDQLAATAAPPDRTPPGDELRMEAMAANLKHKLFGSEVERPRFGRFEVRREVGSGGMGVVYEGWDPDLERKVALKVLHARSGDTSAQRKRLVREAQTLAKLRHPNVVQVYEVGVQGDRFFIAMEFVEGETLREWIARGQPQWREVLDKYVEAGRGLAAAHAEGLVHRDFKPDNVMVTTKGEVRVLDFGLARAEPLEDIATLLEGLTADELTKTGAILGTPAYMAPEQHVGGETDARTDQFSFCVALYEALYGERPFAGKTMPELSAAVVGGDIAGPPKGSSVPSWLREVVVRGLARKSEQRWASMDQLAAALASDPAQRRKRVLYGLGGVTLVGGAVAAALAVGRAEPSGCLDSADKWAGVWDDGVRSSLKAKLGAEAGDDWGRLEQRLDEHRAAWDDVAEANCDARRDASHDPNTLALETLCLESSVDEAAVLTGLLQSGDSALAEGAVVGAERLESPERCRGGETMLHRPLPPQDPDELQEYRRLRAELRKAEILGALARFDAQGETLEAARAAAERAGFEGLAAEATLLTAALTQDRGIRAGTQASDGLVLRLEREAFSRAQAAGDDVIAARAAAAEAIQLANLGELNALETWLPVARSLVERTGDFTAAHSLLVTESALARLRGEDARAVAKMREALAVAREANDAGLIRPTLGNMVVVTNRGDDAQQGAAIREVRDWHIERYGADHPESRRFTRLWVGHTFKESREAGMKLLDEAIPPARRARPAELDASDAELLAFVAHDSLEDVPLATAASERWFELAEADARLPAGLWLMHMYSDVRDAKGLRSALERVDPTGELRHANPELEHYGALLALLENDPDKALRLLGPDEGFILNSGVRVEALLMAGRPEEALPLAAQLVSDDWPAQEAANRVLEARIRHALGEAGAVRLGQDKCRDWLAQRSDLLVFGDLSVCDGLFKPPPTDE